MQLLLSDAWTIVLTMKASPIAVFPRRGLAPHQYQDVAANGSQPIRAETNGTSPALAPGADLFVRRFLAPRMNG